MTKQEIILAHKEHLFPTVFHYFSEPLVLDHAKDQFVFDADGNEYLDFFGGIVTVSVGHCNDAVNKKVKEQVDTLEHVSTAYVTEPQVKLAQKVAPKTPGNGALSKFYFTNSGTEANETAFLTARMYTGSQEIVALATPSLLPLVRKMTRRVSVRDDGVRLLLERAGVLERCESLIDLIQINSLSAGVTWAGRASH